MAFNTVFLGLGSNLGDRGANVQQALTDLERWGVKVILSSSLYETEPVGNIDQPRFLNMTVKASTDRSPEDLLTVVLSIERSLGRVRRGKWGPRTIDVDILFYGDRVVGESGLVIPHPRLHDRRFVLEPMNEIAPDFVHPVLKKSIKELLNACPDKSIVTLLR